MYLKVKGVFTQADPLALINKWQQLTVRIIAMLQSETTAWVVANLERLPVEQALNIAAVLTTFGIPVNGFILNKMLPLELCSSHPFWMAKFASQQRCRQRLVQRRRGAEKNILGPSPRLCASARVHYSLRNELESYQLAILKKEK